MGKPGTPQLYCQSRVDSQCSLQEVKQFSTFVTQILLSVTPVSIQSNLWTDTIAMVQEIQPIILLLLSNPSLGQLGDDVIFLSMFMPEKALIQI